RQEHGKRLSSDWSIDSGEKNRMSHGTTGKIRGLSDSRRFSLRLQRTLRCGRLRGKAHHCYSTARRFLLGYGRSSPARRKPRFFFRFHLEREIRERISDVFELISDFLLPKVHFRELLFRRFKVLIHAILPRADFEIIKTLLLVLAFSASVR